MSLKIAFDTDDTLIIPDDATQGQIIPNYEVIKVFLWFQEQGADMIIWSGSGVDWATRWKEKLGLEARVIRKGSEKVDIAFDDMEVKLGKVNVKVYRINNNIKRKKWRKIRNKYIARFLGLSTKNLVLLFIFIGLLILLKLYK